MRSPMLLRVGSLLLAVSSLGILAAPITILRTHPDLATRSGRHVFAGAMGLSAVALLECLLALVPLRRGERWALLVAALPFLVVGLPIFVVDATYVPRATRWNTLAPQAAGLLMGTLALVLCGLGLAGKRGGA